jgi:hypothetical protein
MYSFFPVVPKTKQELEYNYQRHIQRTFDKAINAFIAVGQSLKVVIILYFLIIFFCF